MGAGASKSKAAAPVEQAKPNSAPANTAKALEGVNAPGTVRSLSQDGQEHLFKADPKAGKASELTAATAFPPVGPVRSHAPEPAPQQKETPFQPQPPTSMKPVPPSMDAPRHSPRGDNLVSPRLAKMASMETSRSIGGGSTLSPQSSLKSPLVPKKIDAIGEQSDGAALARDLKAVLPPLPDEGKPWATVFGESVVRCFYSSEWKEREHCLSSLTRVLSDPKSSLRGKDSKLVYQYGCEMLATTLKDKTAPIFHASLDLIIELLTTFHYTLQAPVLHAGMDLIMPAIIARCGNLSGRIHEASVSTVLQIAGFSHFGISYVGPFAVSELPKRHHKAGQAAQLCGRLDLIYCLMTEFHSHRGLPVEEVMAMAKLGLENPDGHVRQAAIKVIAESHRLHRMDGKRLELERYGLGSQIKPALMQLLVKRLEEVDEEPLPPRPKEGQGSSTRPPPLISIPSSSSFGAPRSNEPTPTSRGRMDRNRSLPGPPSSSGRSPSLSRAASSRQNTISTPPDEPVAPDARVPKYSVILAPKVPSRFPQPIQSPVSMLPGALDEQDESLIIYIMADQRIMV